MGARPVTDDIRKLLGGYATGTLTDAERQALFDAALHDQHLFDTIADEQALKDLLDDPAARAQLLDATESPRFNLRTGLLEWFARPKAKLLASLGGTALVAVLVTTVRDLGRVPVRMVENRQPSLAATPRPPAVEESKEQIPPAAKPTVPKPPHTLRRLPQPEPVTVQPQAIAMRDVAQIATAGPVMLEYTLLRKTADGAFEPVPPGHQFAAGDTLALRAQANAAGAIALSSPGTQISYSQILQPGKPEIIAAATGIRASEVNRLFLAFIPREAPVAPSTLLPAAPAAEFRAKSAAAPAQALPSPLNVEIKIHHKPAAR
jgi:hypothetical protein